VNEEKQILSEKAGEKTVVGISKDAENSGDQKFQLAVEKIRQEDFPKTRSVPVDLVAEEFTLVFDCLDDSDLAKVVQRVSHIRGHADSLSFSLSKGKWVVNVTGFARLNVALPHSFETKEHEVLRDAMIYYLVHFLESTRRCTIDEARTYRLFALANK
jgi:hypothetical protein